MRRTYLIPALCLLALPCCGDPEFDNSNHQHGYDAGEQDWDEQGFRDGSSSYWRAPESCPA